MQARETNELITHCPSMNNSIDRSTTAAVWLEPQLKFNNANRLLSRLTMLMRYL